MPPPLRPDSTDPARGDGPQAPRADLRRRLRRRALARRPLPPASLPATQTLAQGGLAVHAGTPLFIHLKIEVLPDFFLKKSRNQ